MKYEDAVMDGMKYIIRYPNDYKQGNKYPVIVLLHGAGSRGNDLTVLRRNAYFEITDEMQDFPFISVAPQCSEDTWFDMYETLKKLIEKISAEGFCDSSRMYLMGASMGGYGTWQIAMSMPEYFAAIVPICGGGMYWNAARLVNVPVWAFHGKKDPTVFVEESEKMVEAVNKNGGNAKLTIYEECYHNAWRFAYADAEVYDWLLAHTNTNQKTIEDKYHDGKIYG